MRKTHQDPPSDSLKEPKSLQDFPPRQTGIENPRREGGTSIRERETNPVRQAVRHVFSRLLSSLPGKPGRVLPRHLGQGLRAKCGVPDVRRPQNRSGMLRRTARGASGRSRGPQAAPRFDASIQIEAINCATALNRSAGIGCPTFPFLYNARASGGFSITGTPSRWATSRILSAIKFCPFAVNIGRGSCSGRTGAPQRSVSGL
jgi:hypothetical protein